MKSKLKIFFIEPQNLLRAALVNLVRMRPNLEVVGDARNADNTVIEAIKKASPDIVVVTVEMSGQSSVEIIKIVKEACPTANFLAIAGASDKWLFYRLLRAGCRGYLLKSAVETEFFNAINVVSTGASYIGDSMVTSLIDFEVHGNEEEKTNPKLSGRERQIIKLIAAGHSSKAIGEQIGLSYKTIDTYRARILAKLNLRNRSELLLYCVQNGFVDYQAMPTLTELQTGSRLISATQ